MSMPWFFAVVWIGSSGRPTTVWPFSLNSIGIIASCWGLTRSMAVAPFSSTHFVREIPHHAQRRVRRRLAQPADRRVHHRLRQLLQERLVPLLPVHHLQRLHRADPARRALAAGLVLEERHQVLRRIGGLV